MSLRARLIVAMVTVGVVLVIAALTITRTTESHLVGQLDSRLADAMPPAERVIEGAPPGGGFVVRGTAGPFSSLYVGHVWDDGRTQTEITPNELGDVPPVPDIPTKKVLALDAGERRYFDVGSDTGTRFRLLASRDAGDEPVLLVATPRDDVDATIGRLVMVELTTTGAIVAVLALVTFWVLRLGVRPIKRMTQTASSIAAGDLSQRVHEGVGGTEAGDLSVALNGMLGRLEQAFDERTRSEDRLRRFVADASHELRTPVTTIRGYAELYRSGALEDDDELREAMRRTEQEALRMGSLVDDLLLLARLDQGRPLEHEEVDLSALAEDAVRDARAVDPDRPISASVPGRVVVIGDDGRLRQVVGNLVRNALVHTPPRTPIKVRVHRANGKARLEVRDEGPGMSTEVAAKAFERFYRADPSRTRARGGSGLGLAIVDATVRAHDGVVSLDTAPGRGTTVSIEFSLANST
jgi:two-component system OmpR family sensor kinase